MERFGIKKYRLPLLYTVVALLETQVVLKAWKGYSRFLHDGSRAKSPGSGYYVRFVHSSLTGLSKISQVPGA